MSAVLTRRSRPNRVIVPSSPSCHPPSYRLRLPPTGRFLEHAPHLAAKTTKLLCSGACLFAAISWHTTTINSGLINKSKNNRRQHDDKITQSHKKDIFFPHSNPQNHCSPFLSACRSSVIQNICHQLADVGCWLSALPCKLYFISLAIFKFKS